MLTWVSGQWAERPHNLLRMSLQCIHQYLTLLRSVSLPVGRTAPASVEGSPLQLLFNTETRLT